MKNLTQKKSQQSGLSQGLAEYEPMVPCQADLLAIRGYTKVDGKWVAPKNG